MHPLLTILLTVLVGFLIRDIAGYVNARREWLKNGKQGPEPEFDPKLFWGTVALGLLTGLGAWLGVAPSTGGT